MTRVCACSMGGCGVSAGGMESFLAPTLSALTTLRRLRCGFMLRHVSPRRSVVTRCGRAVQAVTQPTGQRRRGGAQSSAVNAGGPEDVGVSYRSSGAWRRRRGTVLVCWCDVGACCCNTDRLAAVGMTERGANFLASSLVSVVALESFRCVVLSTCRRGRVAVMTVCVYVCTADAALPTMPSAWAARLCCACWRCTAVV
jgi:hypothetical protein